MSQIVNPDMIVLARETRGITQKGLAEKLGLEQYQVSRMESGQLPLLVIERLEDLSRLLRYPKKFFYQNFYVYPAGMHLYRKHKTLPAKELAQIAAMMNVFREHIKGFLDAAEIEYKPVKECDIDEYGSPEEIARAIRQYLHLPRGPVKNMTKVLEDFGVVVVPFESNRKFSGASLLTEKPNYITAINSTMPGDRYRHTLAHELGHIVMHSLPRPEMEEEAERFACEFLMPIAEIGHNLHGLTLEKLASLKKYWKVSMASILKHAHRNEKITDRHYRTIWLQMGKAGYRLQEPKDLEIPAEKPTLLPELIDFHIKELGYSLEQLSDKVAADPEEFAALYKLATNKLKLVRKVS
jgi:Zn-dependent peptidase ImmA (M78 family)/transcriptional regulator with XRE-family HTH domain